MPKTQQLDRYLDRLTHTGFLKTSTENNRKMYYLTETGRRYVDYYRDLAPMVDKILLETDADSDYEVLVH